MGLTARMAFVPVWGLRASSVVVAALVLAIGVGAARVAPAGLSVVRTRGAARGLMTLPVSAQGTVSADLGRDDPRYRVLGADDARGASAVGGAAGAQGMHAANPGQGFAERFSQTGVTLSSGRARFTLALAGVGRGTQLLAPPASAARAVDNRVSYDRGGLHEWYVNGPLGLEQGFDLARRPAGRGVLTLAVALSGASSVRLRDGSALFSGAGVSLRYRGLSAVDARGRALRAWLGLSAGRLLIRVDDRGARYPVRIDPFVGQGEPFTAGGEVGAGAFGYSVALSADGNTALIGGPQDNGNTGAAWVFTRSGGVWTQQGPKLTADDESGAGLFGESVALSHDGDTALIGGGADNNEVGAAWVFMRSGGVWTQQGPKLTADDESGTGLFGESVALSSLGNTALIGAPGNAGGVGAAWVFSNSVAGWTQETELDGSGESGSGLFGVSVAMTSETGAITALIGAPGDAGSIGAAWVFSDVGEGWTQQGSKLVAATAVEKPAEGFSVSLSGAGGIALIGAPGAGEGAAWVFKHSEGGTWVPETRLAVPGQGTLGVSVALSAEGDTAVLSGIGESGVWEFRHIGSTWIAGTKVIGGSAVLALSSDGDTLLVGGPSSNNEDGFAGVLVNMPELEIEHSGNGSQPGSNTATSHHFALGRETTSSNGAVELAVEVPGAGVLSASQVAAVATEDRASTSSVRHMSKKKKSRSKSKPADQPTVLIGSVKETIGYPETAVLTIEPTTAALRELAQRQTISVPVNISFTASDGQVSTATTNISFTRPGYSFEAGSEGWSKAWGNLTATGSTTHAHTGKHSLRIEIHANGYSAVNVTAGAGVLSESPLGLLRPGVPISMWVYRPAGTPPVGFQAIVRVGSEWAECRSLEVRPRANRWVQLRVTVPSSANCTGVGEPNLEVHGVGVEIDDRHGGANGKSVYLDDVSW
jgi:hypothetical protein